MLISMILTDNVFAQTGSTQLGANPSSADQIAFNSSQGVAAQIQAKIGQTYNSGAWHWHWVAAGIKEPQGDVFTQMGILQKCHGCPLVPFIFTFGSSVPATDGFMATYNQYPLPNLEYITFWFQTNGVQNPDGTYNWEFWFSYPGRNDTKLTTLKFKSKFCKAPYIVSEVAGVSGNPCNDIFHVIYGSGSSTNNYALIAYKNGSWSWINHTTAYYGLDNCNRNVKRLAVERVRMDLSPTTVQSTCNGCSVW